MNADRIVQGLRTTFPELTQVEPLSFLGTGFGSVAVETAAGVVFRIAKTSVTGKHHKRENELLPLLQQYITDIAIPEPAYYVSHSEAFPFGVFGYEKIDGVALSPAYLSRDTRYTIASQVANFIHQLHNVPISQEIRALNLSVFPPSVHRLRQIWARITPRLQHAFEPAEFREIARWYDDAIQQWTTRTYEPVLVHGDLWYENILVHPDTCTVAGIIDFEEVAIGDPATDIMTQQYLGDEFMRDVLAELRANSRGTNLEHVEERLDVLLGLRELMGLAYGIKIGYIDPDTYDKIRTTVLEFGIL